MADLISAITPFIQEYGIFGVFIFSLVEEIIAPVPSSVALMAAGFFFLPAAQDSGQIFVNLFLKIVLPAALGLTLGALCVYSVAYLGGGPIIRKWGRFFGITWETIQNLEERLARAHTDELIIFGLRAMPLTPNFLISAVCGLIRYPVKTFLSMSFLGSIVRAFLMGLLGWSMGEAYLGYAQKLSKLGTYVFIGLGILIVAGIVYLFVKRRVKSSKI